MMTVEWAYILGGCILVSLLGGGLLWQVNSRKKERIKVRWQASLRHQSSIYGEENLRRAAESITKIRGKALSIDDMTWSDLDMYDIFRGINLTYSNIGGEFLYTKLRMIDVSGGSEDTSDLENMIAYFEAHPNEREAVQYEFSTLGQIYLNHSYSYFEEQSNQQLLKLFKFTPLGMFPIIALCFIMLNPFIGVILFVGSLLLNTLIYFFFKTKVELELGSMGYLVRSLYLGRRLSKMALPGASDLKSAIKPFRGIFKYGLFFRVKMGSEMEVVIEMLFAMFLLPFISFKKVLRRIIDQNSELWQVWELLANYEIAYAILHYRETHEWCHPTYCESAEIVAENMSHPLLQKGVKNNVRANRTSIVTGSNASGKSTYIKGIASNCILSQSLNMALGDYFVLKRGHIISTMGVRDNLNEGDSYFMAEIKGLRRLLLAVEKQPFTYCFIDEILRGTNTKERIAASSSVIKWLGNQSCLSFLATHDMELPEIFKQSCHLLYFSENVDQQAGYQFDYQVKKGINKEMNGIKLLKQLDFPSSITTQAYLSIAYFELWKKWPKSDD